MSDIKNIEQHYSLDERPFLEKVRGFCQLVEDRYSPYLTDFLNPRQIQIVEDLANYYNLKSFVSSSLETEEYGRVILAPDYYELDEDDFEIKRLEIVYARQFNKLTHPKVLGALINQLGLERQVFGDIILDDEGRVQFNIASHLSSYAIMTITKIGNVSVTLKEVSKDNWIVNQESYSQSFVLLSSVRLDNILATILKVSRSNAMKLIVSGKVKLNYRQVEKADQIITIGDMISVRGYGRFRLAQQEGVSKSGKAKVVIESLLRRRKK